MAYRYPNITYAGKTVPTDEPVPTFRYNRNNFLDAGVNNYTQAPAQDPDMYEQLTNIMSVTDGRLARRWGYSLFANPGVEIDQLIDYQSDLTGVRALIAAANNSVRAYNDDGSAYNSNIYAPSKQPRAAVSRSYSYFSSGAAGDYKKWNGASTGGTTKWGIDVNDATGASSGAQGPLAPGTATAVGSGVPTPGSQGPFGPGSAINAGLEANGWSPLISGVSTADGTFSIARLNDDIGQPVSDTLLITNFGLSVPGSATITGVQVDVLRQSDSDTTTPNVFDGGVFLLLNGSTPAGTDHSNLTSWPYLAESYANYGNSTDVWGLSLAPGDVNASTFGVAITAQMGTPPVDLTNFYAEIDFVQITIFYTTPAPPAWSNPNNIKANDGASATITASTSGSSSLQATNFGFTVADGNTITGILVEVKCAASGGTAPLLNLALDKASAAYTGVVGQALPGSLGFISYGGQGNVWGGLWTPADIRNSGFGAEFYATTSAGSSAVSVDFIRITVYYAQIILTLNTASAGAVTLTSGRTYAVVFSNANTGHYSDLSVFSASTGAITSKEIILTVIPVSNDTQVTHTNLLATADGNDETRLFLVAQLAAGTTTYTDNTPEATLLTQPVLLSTDVTGAEFGVSNNDPPPTGFIIPTKHRGRLYMINGASLAWTKSIAEVTTDTNFIAGRWEEAWDPANQLDISEGAESARGALSDGTNLYIGSEFKIQRLNGDAPFLEPPEVIHNQAGIMNQDVWKIVFAEGQPVGSMWLTPDYRIVVSDFNTYQDVGWQIQTTLNNINPLAVSTTARATFYSNGPLDLYIIAIPTGNSQTNDTLCVYNLRTKKWVIWNFTDSVTALLFNIKASGTPQLVFGAPSGMLYQLVQNSTQDRIGNTPTPYTASIQTSWLALEDPSLRKSLNEIEIGTGDASMLVTVYGGSKPDDFASNGNTVVANAPVVLSPRNEYKVYLAGQSTKDRFYKFLFTSTTTVQTLLNSYTIEAVGINRQ